MYFWPPLLSLVSRAAPARINSTMMGMAFIVLFVANNLIGWIGTFYERMTPIAFWALRPAAHPSDRLHRQNCQAEPPQ